jgi:DNA polymerase III sliding clamp (beta) subunit (PCNA family)
MTVRLIEGMILENMNFTCDRNALLNEVAKAQEALSALFEIHLEAKKDVLYIKATNSKDDFESKLPATIKGEKSVTLFGGKFLSVLNIFPEGELEFTQNSLSIITMGHLTWKGKVQFRLVSKDEKDDHGYG